MLNLVLAESAIELIPSDLWKHPAVMKRSRLIGKNPGQMLLDRSYHHAAMLQIEDGRKRGRPDIAHFCLLNALGAPLNLEGGLRTSVHTREDKLIVVDPETRLPRNYDRFVGLVEQLYSLGKVPAKGRTLLEIRSKTLSEHICDINPSRTVALSRAGVKSTIEKVVEIVAEEPNPLFLIGGFPAGSFGSKTIELADDVFSIYPETLDAWVVVARVIYEYEKMMGLSSSCLTNHVE
jgi:rRNA small subunit pseudouridine methyltransferase Nep1